MLTCSEVDSKQILCNKNMYKGKCNPFITWQAIKSRNLIKIRISFKTISEILETSSENFLKLLQLSDWVISWNTLLYFYNNFHQLLFLSPLRQCDRNFLSVLSVSQVFVTFLFQETDRIQFNFQYVICTCKTVTKIIVKVLFTKITESSKFTRYFWTKFETKFENLRIRPYKFCESHL